jgi:hypothetical protein
MVFVRHQIALLFAAVAAASALIGSSAAASELRRGHRVGVAGVTLAIPASWHAIPLVSLSPGMEGNDPTARIVVSSGPIWFGRGCNDVDYSFPSTAVALVVLEWVRPTPGSFPLRPRRFTSTNLPIRRPPSIECFNGPGGSFAFQDHGRRFDAFLLLGRRAPRALVDRARAVLDTLTVRRARR